MLRPVITDETSTRQYSTAIQEKETFHQAAANKINRNELEVRTLTKLMVVLAKLRGNIAVLASEAASRLRRLNCASVRLDSRLILTDAILL